MDSSENDTEEANLPDHSAKSFPLIEAFHEKHVSAAIRANLKSGEIIGTYLDQEDKEIKIICRPQIEQTWNIRQIAQECSPIGWLEVFQDSWPALIDISNRIEREGREFYPLKENLFKVFDLCPLDQVRVVIMGQDPYHSTDHLGRPIAQGMSFSIPRGVTIPPSLRNIYKVLAKTIPGFQMPNHGDLTHWVEQGVFMLNSDLTVLPHKAKSHHKYWICFINKVLKAIVDTNPDVIFLLWGREAQKTTKDIIGDRDNILETSHPSGYSARYGFLDCDHFNQVNQILTKLEQPQIDWQIPN